MDVILILLICEPVLCLQNSHKQNINLKEVTLRQVKLAKN